MIYSFDIFDTLITRRVKNPYFIFDRIEEKIGKNWISTKIESFRKLRIEAERSARKKSKYEEITFQDIYREFTFISGIKKEFGKRIAEIEIETEVENCLPIAQTVQYFNTIRHFGERVILISDMYLSCEVIKRILSRCGIQGNDINIYVSSEYRKTKATGNLFHLVRKMEGVDFKEINHFGDNVKSDYVIPKMLGIHARICKSADFNRYEKKLKRYDKTNILPEVSRCNRLIGHDVEDIDLWNVTTSIMGPMLISYLAWIHDICANENIKKLYFVARDGEIMYKVWDILYKEDEISYSYLYGSRKAWYLPSVMTRDDFEDSISNGGWIFQECMEYSLREVLCVLELEEYAPSIIEELGLTKEQYTKAYSVNELDLLKSLLLREAMVTRVLERAWQKRQLVLKYFGQEGLLEGQKIGLVDLGWTGKSLDAAKRMIEAETTKDTIIGFLIRKRGCNLKHASWLHSWMYQKKKCLPSEVYLLESLFAASHSTTIAYVSSKEKVKPCLKDDEMVKWNITIQQEAVLSFVKEYKKYDRKASYPSDKILRIYKDFVLSPDKEAINAFAFYPFSRNLGDRSIMYLAPERNIVELVKNLECVVLLKEKIFHRKEITNIFWNEASARQIGKLAVILVKLDDFLIDALYGIQNYLNR